MHAAAARRGSYLDAAGDLALEFIDVADDAYPATLLPQVDECFHGQVERLGVEAAEAFVNEQGVELDTARIALNHIRETQCKSKRSKNPSPPDRVLAGRTRPV